MKGVGGKERDGKREEERDRGGEKGKEREGILLLPPHSTDPAYSPASAC